MSRSVAELPKVAGTCPGPLIAAMRRAVRSGAAASVTASAVDAAAGEDVKGPVAALRCAPVRT